MQSLNVVNDGDDDDDDGGGCGCGGGGGGGGHHDDASNDLQWSRSIDPFALKCQHYMGCLVRNIEMKIITLDFQQNLYFFLPHFWAVWLIRDNKSSLKRDY